MFPAPDIKKPFAVHLLDVGKKEYGDSLLCQFGDVSILIDGAHTGDQVGKGGHESIPDQIGRLLKQTQTPYRVTLLMVSHAHEDHIGCLPNLVANDLLVADFALVTDPLLGWGRTPNDDAQPQPADPRVRKVVAALREHVRTAKTSSDSLEEFIADAAGLEGRYNTMLKTLAQSGTVIRHGRDNPKKLIDALKPRDVELKILGPSENFLLLCAERIRGATDDAMRSVADAFGGDDSLSSASLYRRLVESGESDALDDAGRLGAAVNLQSIVTCFKYKNKKFLFAGDMQFQSPGVAGAEAFMPALRKAITKEGPYAFVKLSHHGAANGFSENIFQELNANGPSKVFGICAGEDSTAHPNPATLSVLKKHTAEITWARTDHNRQSSFFFDQSPPRIVPGKGKLNDPKPNTDEAISAPVESPVVPAPIPLVTLEKASPAQNIVVASKGEVVEVNVRMPHASTKVTLTIDVEPRGGAPADRGESSSASDLPPLRIAGGRQLPKLLFATSKEALARNIGQGEAEHVLRALRAQNNLVFDQIPAAMSDSVAAAALVRDQLRRNPDVKGVVLLGGYDVVPSQRVDCLPAALRSRVAGNGDADNFIVWSDDIFGDIDGDFLPELPVSRIPDGNRAQLVFAAVQADAAALGQPKIGVRNIARPFADRVYGNLPGAGSMLVSQPVTYDVNPPYSLSGDRVYIMLHGDYVDSARFWGEDTEGDREAVNISNLPTRSGAVVFTGCCWGALTVNTPAGRVATGRVFGQKSPDDSLAMSFLARGAVGFIGCTGSHYSPLQPPFRFFGGPMHEAFWLAHAAGRPPAQALFDAKLQYLKGMPHGQTRSNSLAIEYKILRQYTCLGLGW